jgi:hypothetical protein
MARNTIKSKKGTGLPFVYMAWEILNSAAFKALTPSAGKALPFFLGKPKKPYGDRDYYEIVFTFPYGEAIRFGFARATFFKIVEELIAKGFIDSIQKGGLRGEGKSFNRFKLSERWRGYGTKFFTVVSWKEFQPK